MNFYHQLLAVSGLTPQVVTETLYAIHQQGEPMPKQIDIITTEEGYQRAKLTLINQGWLAKFYLDYQLQMPSFTEANIHILQQADGQALNDIRTHQDNQAIADGITEWIRIITAKPETALHVSIAGGRKTMGFYAGYALSLYGRAQDKLSHVLVSAEFESNQQFYYPTPYSQVIFSQGNNPKPLDTQNAQVMLADIAFVRLRHGLDESLLQGKSSFSVSVAKAQQLVGPIHLTIDVKQRSLIINDTVIKLIAADFAFYLWLLARQKSGLPAPYCPNEGVAEAEYAEQFLKHFGVLGCTDRTASALIDGMTKSYFEQRKSRINKALNHVLHHAAQPYLISPVGKRPRTGYSILISTEQIDYV